MLLLLIYVEFFEEKSVMHPSLRLALYLGRKEKEALERRCAEDMAALTFQAQRREHELTQTLQQMEAQHERNGGCPLACLPLPKQPPPVIPLSSLFYSASGTPVTFGWPKGADARHCRAAVLHIS